MALRSTTILAMVSDDERALFEAWCDGDRKAGEALFDRHYEGIARFFRNKTDEASAADLVQATFLACTEGRERFRGASSVRTYLFSIAHNLLRKHYEKRRRAPEATDVEALSVFDMDPSPTERIHAREEQRLLLEALRRIPLECQAVLELHYWEKLGTAEIAEIVSVPEGTVKSRLIRGRKLLEEKIEALASSRDALESTTRDLDRWAGELRLKLGRSP